MTDTRTYVTSLDQVRQFRIYLARFLDTAITALTEADSRVEAMVRWIKQDRLPYWKKRVARLSEQLVKARQELNRKRTFEEIGMGAQLSFVDEKKAVVRLQRLLNTAREKQAAAKRWMLQLEKEGLEFQGMVQELSTALQIDIPQMRAKIDAMLMHLEKYLALAPDSQTLQVDLDLTSAADDADDTNQPARSAQPYLHDRRWLDQLRRIVPRTVADRNAPDLGDRPTGLEPYRLSPEVMDGFLVATQAGAPVTPATASSMDHQFVLIEEQLDRCERIYLCRTGESSQDDSGWTIASLSLQTPKRFYRVDLATLQQRAAWTGGLMELPEGSLIVTSRLHLEAVYDMDNRPLWSTQG